MKVEAQRKEGDNLLWFTCYTEALGSLSDLNVIHIVQKSSWNEFCAEDEVGSVSRWSGIYSNL